MTKQILNKTTAYFYSDQTVQIKTPKGSIFKEKEQNKDINGKHYTYQAKSPIIDSQKYNLEVDVDKDNFVVIEQDAWPKGSKKVLPTMEQELNVKTGTLEYLAHQITANKPVKQLTKININPMSKLVYLNGFSWQKKINDSELRIKISLDEENILDNNLSQKTLPKFLDKGISVSEYSNYQVLIMMHPKIDMEYLNHLRAVLRQLVTNCYFQVDALSNPGFKIQFLFKNNDDIKVVIGKCQSLFNEELLKCTLCL